MAVEEKFGISITDEEATKAVTVGDLKHLVRTKHFGSTRTPRIQIERSDLLRCLLRRRHAMTRVGRKNRGFKIHMNIER
jgi:hypothetical protein